ncbi:hypothetical protein D3C71_1553130 [compost metagenome]
MRRTGRTSARSLRQKPVLCGQSLSCVLTLTSKEFSSHQRSIMLRAVWPRPIQRFKPLVGAGISCRTPRSSTRQIIRSTTHRLARATLSTAGTSAVPRGSRRARTTSAFKSRARTTAAISWLSGHITSRSAAVRDTSHRCMSQGIAAAVALRFFGST